MPKMDSSLQAQINSLSNSQEMRSGRNQVIRHMLGRNHSRSEEHTSELQSLRHLVCRLLLEKKNHPDTKPRPSPDRQATPSAVSRRALPRTRAGESGRGAPVRSYTVADFDAAFFFFKEGGPHAVPPLLPTPPLCP